MRKLILIAAAAFALAAAAPADAQQGNYEPFAQPSGAQVPAFVMMCATGTGRQALPCGGISAPVNVMTLPFVRATRNTFTFPATTSPQQFLITQPANSTTYRAFNPCAQADVRITSVAAIAPLVTESTAYPGVQRVTSATDTIDAHSGVRFGRGSETLGSAPNPNGGQQRIVSIMLVPIPGYPADLSGLTCEFELGYGNGG